MLVNALPHHRNGRPTQHVLLTLVGVALLLHAALLSGVQLGLPQPGRSAAAPVQVRMLTAPDAVVAIVAPAAEPSVAPPPQPAAPRPAPARVPTPRVEAAASQAVAVVPPPPANVTNAAPAASAASVTETRAEAVAAAAETPASREGEIPLYRTLFPPPLTLHYALSRGGLSGTGELQWRPAGGQYELRLEGRLAGLPVLVQNSQGGFDDAGIAPLRFTDRRMRRDVKAANFQRAVGKITFSGPSTEYPLLIGAQDRLSWMIQLAAVAAAEPQRTAPGGKVALYVVGARGDADLWIFRYVAHEDVATVAGPVAAVKFAREPRGAYDTQVEAWLDPTRHHLPVRARLSHAPDSEALELLLYDITPTP